MKPRLIAFLLVALPLASAHADVKLNELFTDNMVLQANFDDPIWGTAGPGEEITVTLSGEPAFKTKVQADSNGHWKATMPKMRATQNESDALTVTVEGKNKITLKNVLVGEVWICSGQ